MFHFRATMALCGLLVPALLLGDTLQFTNGDRLSGSLVSETDGKIVFKSDLVGEITVPADQATIVPEAPADTMADTSAALAAEAGAAPNPPPADDTSETAKEQSAVDSFNAGVDRFRSYVDYIVPAGWSGKFNFGVSFIDTNTSSEAWNVKIAAEKVSGKNTYAIGAFYNFSSQTDVNGIQSKTLDKWGGNFTYDRELSERWFLQSDTQYLRDMVKNIDHRATETVSLGYKVVDEEDFTFDILPGVAGQYQEVQGNSDRWLGYVTFGDDLMYRFSEIFRVEQNAGIRMDPTDLGQYQLGFNAAFIAKLNEWIEASLNYQYTYDTTVGPGSPRAEQQIIFGIGIPF